jgi:hypothetical protein
MVMATMMILLAMTTIPEINFFRKEVHMKSLEMVEITENNYIDNPFPLSLEAQKRLLELIYNRKSGIITRQELIDVLFNPEDSSKGTIIKNTL